MKAAEKKVAEAKKKQGKAAEKLQAEIGSLKTKKREAGKAKEKVRVRMEGQGGGEIQVERGSFKTDRLPFHPAASPTSPSPLPAPSLLEAGGAFSPASSPPYR